MVAGVVMAVLLPVCAGFVVHYGYLTNYTTVTFSEEGFREQYENDVYSYRPLSREFLLLLHDWFDRKVHALDRLLLPHRLLDLDEQADATFYHMYAWTRIVGLVLFSSFLWLLLGLRRFALSLRGRIAAVGGFLLLLALSMFVVTPYDVWSWASIIASFLLLLSEEQRHRWLLPLLLFLATMNHESSILILAVLGTVLWEEGGMHALRSPLLWLSVLAFVLPYFGVRLLTDGWAVHSRVLFPDNILAAPAAGVAISALFIVSLTSLAFAVSSSSERLVVYTTLALPWIAGVLLFGILWELRLWSTYLIPLFLFALLPMEGDDRRGLSR